MRPKCKFRESSLFTGIFLEFEHFVVLLVLTLLDLILMLSYFEAHFTGPAIVPCKECESRVGGHSERFIELAMVNR
jgi:hypothetical protein